MRVWTMKRINEAMNEFNKNHTDLLLKSWVNTGLTLNVNGEDDLENEKPPKHKSSKSNESEKDEQKTDEIKEIDEGDDDTNIYHGAGVRDQDIHFIVDNDEIPDADGIHVQERPLLSQIVMHETEVALTNDNDK